MFHASGIILYTLQIVFYFNFKILFNKIRYHSLGNMLYVNKAQWCSNAMNEGFIFEWNNDTLFKLEGNKNNKFWYVTGSSEWSFLGNINKTRMNSWLEMGKSSSSGQMYLRVHPLRGLDDQKKSFNIYVRVKCSKQNICIMWF